MPNDRYKYFLKRELNRFNERIIILITFFLVKLLYKRSSACDVTSGHFQLVDDGCCLLVEEILNRSLNRRKNVWFKSRIEKGIESKLCNIHLLVYLFHQKLFRLYTSISRSSIFLWQRENRHYVFFFLRSLLCHLIYQYTQEYQY